MSEPEFYKSSRKYWFLPRFQELVERALEVASPLAGIVAGVAGRIKEFRNSLWDEALAG